MQKRHTMLNDIHQINRFFKKLLTSEIIFTTKTHKSIVKKFDYVLSLESISLIVITGEGGSGKSTLLQSLEHHVQTSYTTFVLKRPCADVEVYKKYLCDIANIAYSPKCDEGILLKALQQSIQTPTILFIDACEEMDFLQMQLTLKLAYIKQIVLVLAMPSLSAKKLFNETRLNLGSKVEFTCNPLSQDEIAEYTSFLLEQMNQTSHSIIFPHNVFLDLHYYTQGNWKKLNTFLHQVFKSLYYQRNMSDVMDSVSSTMLAKIAFKQKIITIHTFKKKGSL